MAVSMYVCVVGQGDVIYVCGVVDSSMGLRCVV